MKSRSLRQSQGASKRPALAPRLLDCPSSSRPSNRFPSTAYRLRVRYESVAHKKDRRLGLLTDPRRHRLLSIPTALSQYLLCPGIYSYFFLRYSRDISRRLNFTELACFQR
ncbi:hypothetical protein BDW69DRAFT_40765 [Aspergillus filifer]